MTIDQKTLACVNLFGVFGAIPELCRLSDEAKELVLKAAKMIPQLRYVGWDVAITPDKPVFVEGNQHPGHDILQMPPHVPDKIGMLPRIKQFIDI